MAELPRRTIGYHVYEFEDKLESNFGETQANLVQLGSQRLDAEINLRVLRTFQFAIPNGSPYYTQGAGLSLTALDNAINQVMDETYNGEVVIVGRRSMTGQIVDKLSTANYGGFLPQTNEEMIRRGVLGEYKGAKIVSLRNYRDDLKLASSRRTSCMSSGATLRSSASGVALSRWSGPTTTGTGTIRRGSTSVEACTSPSGFGASSTRQSLRKAIATAGQGNRCAREPER